MKQWKNPASLCFEAYIREQADTCKRRIAGFFDKLDSLLLTVIFLMVRDSPPAKIQLRMKDAGNPMVADP